MHDTAWKIGKLFFDIYQTPEWRAVIDCGAMDMNGSLRSVCPNDIYYIGVDVEFGKSVDVKVNIGESLPFRDDFVDCVVSSSQMEHDDFFWMTFLEYVRIVKPGGYVYINAPSNGAYHRHPNDNWRFYPDCGHVLVRWAKKNGYAVELVESFCSERMASGWNDYVAVFVKGVGTSRVRYIADEFPCRNVWKFGASEPEKVSSTVQDMDLLADALRENDRLVAKVGARPESHEAEIIAVVSDAADPQG